MNHQINRLTGGTDITQPTHSLAQNVISARRYKYIHQISDKNTLSAITANRAFRGMAGLAVLYPSVVDYIGWGLKTL